MSAFEYFLKHSVGYERTHQLILFQLLAIPEFVTEFTGEFADEVVPMWEPNRGLFDLGVQANSQWMIEIKMWSSLGQTQLARQTAYLKQAGNKGIYVLLGTSDIEYIKSGTRDDIYLKSDGYSSKIGYNELLKVFHKFREKIQAKPEIAEFVDKYSKALEIQKSRLLNARFDKKAASAHHYYYSIYGTILSKLRNLRPAIYAVNNPGGPAYIMNDKQSWFGIRFKDWDFELYQEFLNGNLWIRMYSEAPNHLRNELKCKIVSEFRLYPLSRLDWNYQATASKWFRIAVLPLSFVMESDYDKAAALFEEMNQVLGDIAHAI